MAFQTVFQRFELKYLLTAAQKAALLEAIMPHMDPDPYGRATIRSIYYDTENFRLIRRSLEHPAYKEKLRLRSYSQAGPDSTVFAELKKKYQHLVYKRRLPLPAQTAAAWLSGQAPCPAETQVALELDYFLHHYETLRPVLFLSYDREAYLAKAQPDFRVTFDSRILCRQTALSLEAPAYGLPLLTPGLCLMELKCGGGIPLWMSQVLSLLKLYKTSFSKYGTAYETIIYPALKKGALSHVG